MGRAVRREPRALMLRQTFTQTKRLLQIIATAFLLCLIFLIEVQRVASNLEKSSSH